MNTVLKKFVNETMFDASAALLQHLHIVFNEVTRVPVPFEDLYPLDMSKVLTEVLAKVKHTYFIGTIDESSLTGSAETLSAEEITARASEGKYTGMMIFAVELQSGSTLTRSESATLTRGFNRIASAQPVILFIKQGNELALSTCERSKYTQQWRDGEKLGKVSILRGINCLSPHRGHIDILASIGDKTYPNYEELYKHWMEVFSSELLTKKFYTELSEWYAWAIQVMRFPNMLDDDTDNTKYNSESGIRLVTRLIFVWFLKHKGLIPDEFFDEDALKHMIKGFEPTQKEHSLFGYMSKETKYYTAILQNLFFAMLNSPLTEENKYSRGFRKYDAKGNATGANRGAHQLLRYKSLFSDPDRFLRLANKVPFLNGGLFECLDDVDNKFYLDGFSENEKVSKALCVPDYLFFGEQEDIDLSEWYDDSQKRRMKVRGIIDILKSYQFTIEENTPLEQEVSLDPELLGKVFENLLASYNPETNKTARKSTGSYYTPREIVQYMVDESLVAYLKEKVGKYMEEQYRRLLDYSEKEVELTPEQKQQIMSALYQCKALDPACGSGAFPMGMLQQMVHVLTQLDPDNIIWKHLIEEKSKQELADSLNNYSKEERDEVQADINRSFDLSQNAPAYARKLYLIENCIYGVDIQTTAIQISKLRCFISLVIDQKVNNDPVDNYGIRPLPNLEARFVAANTLIGINSDLSLANTEKVVAIKSKLKNANHRIFNAKTMRTKRKWKDNIIAYRKELCKSLEETGFITHDEASLVSSWDMFNQNASSVFFDPDWMFGITNGFDIVIGNPPYLDYRDIDKTTLSVIKSFKSMKDSVKPNLFAFFIEEGICLLNNRGHLVFINPLSMLVTDSTYGLRNFILNNGSVKWIVNVSDLKVFKAASTYVAMWLYSNTKVNDYDIRISNCHNYDDFSKTSLVLYSELVMKDEKHRIPISPNSIIINKLENKNSKLKTISEINWGTSKSGYGRMKISSEQYSGLNQAQQCLYAPIIQTADIKRFTIKWQGEYIPISIYSNSIKNKFIKDKILIARVTKRIQSAFDTDVHYYIGKSLLLTDIKTDPLYLLALLNSKLMSFWYYSKFESTHMNGGYLRYDKPYIEQMPIKKFEKLSEFVQTEIRRIVTLNIKDTVNEIDTEKREQYIDILIYLLYGLTYDEVMVVENASQGEKFNLDKATYDKWLELYTKDGTLPSEEEMEKAVE